MIQNKIQTNKIRLNKYLAHLGVASRRAVDELITLGKISLNGKVVTQLGTKVIPDKDEIVVGNRKIKNALEKLVYIILNKPKGVVSTSKDTFGNTTVLDLVKSSARLYPVGRLDQDSHGLILLTNDGDLTLKLTHPRFHIYKIYLVTILGFVPDSKVSLLRNGVLLDDGKTAPAKVTIVRQGPRQTVLEITLWEGRKRQIRRMCAELHLHLTDLQRIAIGPLTLGDLKIGKWRNLLDSEISALKKIKQVKNVKRG